MMLFWIAAAFLSLVALSFILIPALKAQRKTGHKSLITLGSAALLVPISVFIYLSINTWGGDTELQTGIEGDLPPLSDLIVGLEDRLQTDPEDALGWRLLGQSYLSLGRFLEARNALREAWSRTPAPDVELKLALAEAEAMTDRSSLAGDAGNLFDEVLEIEPLNVKALWYGGLVALDTERPNLARERWESLLSLNPPEQVAVVLREQIQLLGGQSVDTSLLSSGDSPLDAGIEININISFSSELTMEFVNPNSVLFIFARAPEGGPPLAVIRDIASNIPGQFLISDANAMIPGRSLADFESLSIVARVSLSGQPTANQGDLFGEIIYTTSNGSGEVELQIDQVVN
tara:strand:+ start:6708 stop:7745 length:1038 start_codon:yes stop_codon:yes gene_type:complete